MLARSSLTPGPMLEDNLRKALILSGGEFSTFVQRPLSAASLAIAGVVLLSSVLPSIRRPREKRTSEAVSGCQDAYCLWTGGVSSGNF